MLFLIFVTLLTINLLNIKQSQPIQNNIMNKFNLIKVTVLLLFICSVNSLLVKAQVITSAEIDSLVEKTKQTFEVPGIAVAVVKDGSVIHSKGYGVGLTDFSFDFHDLDFHKVK